jgi:hypothetical protein
MLAHSFLRISFKYRRRSGSFNAWLDSSPKPGTNTLNRRTLGEATLIFALGYYSEDFQYNTEDALRFGTSYENWGRESRLMVYQFDWGMELKLIQRQVSFSIVSFPRERYAMQF